MLVWTIRPELRKLAVSFIVYPLTMVLLKSRNHLTSSLLQELELRQQKEQLCLESQSVLEGLKEQLVHVSPS